MSVESLNCPNCGAGVASDHSRCEFCKTRLKTIACVQCLGLMFAGTKFCGHCGATAAPVELSDEATGDCPRCHKDLEKLKVESISFSGCGKCDGLWIDVATFEGICATGERQSAVLGFLAKRSAKPQQLTKVSYVGCPECGQLMNRNNFAKASGVIVDICKPHGVWLDADELPAIIEFVRAGGMEVARQRERNDIERQRDTLRGERQRLASHSARLGMDKGGNEIGIRGFVRSLFE